MLGAGDELQDHAPRLGLGDPGAQGLHPAGRLRGQELLRPPDILNTFVLS